MLTSQQIGCRNPSIDSGSSRHQGSGALAEKVTRRRPASGNPIGTATWTKSARSFLAARGPGRPTRRIRSTPASAAGKISSWYSPSDYGSSSRRNHLQCPNMDASSCQSGRPVPHGRRCHRSGFDHADRFSGYHSRVGSRIGLPWVSSICPTEPA